MTLQINDKTIRAQLFWRTGEEQSILIYRPDARLPWTDNELRILRRNYESARKEDLMAMLPERTWDSIKQRGSAEGLSRKNFRATHFEAFTPEEDELLKAYYTDKIDQKTLMRKTGRAMHSLKGRARRLGIKWQPRRTRWEWCISSQQESSPILKPAN